MSETNATNSAEAQAAEAQTTGSLLEQVINATPQTTSDRVNELLQTFTAEALSGTVSWSKSLTETIQTAIKLLDSKISKQLAAVMHHEKFTKLEGSWRGLRYLVSNSLCSEQLKIKVFNVKKPDLLKDFNKSMEFDQSLLFKKIYESEFGSPGGEPYGLLLGDFEFSNHPTDLDLLEHISHVAAGAFAPFVSAANASMFGMNQWTELSKPRDLEKIFSSAEYIKWRGLRETEDARYVSLTLPRVLARLPYGAATAPVEEFGFEEAEFDAAGKAKALEHDQYCWMNAAYVMGTKMTNCFAENGWCTAIRGAEGGGKVEGLPTHVFTSDDGELDYKCPTEIGITDRREAELSKLGFLPLSHYKNTNYAVFFGGQTIQKPLQYDAPEATSNAAISARLPYIMASSRFAHYLKVMARDKIGSFMEVAEAEAWLNRWILNYMNTNPDCGAWMKAKYPLADAKIQVKEIPGRPGSYNAIAWLRPWLQLEELSTSLRLVARIPKLA